MVATTTTQSNKASWERRGHAQFTDREKALTFWRACITRYGSEAITTHTEHDDLDLIFHIMRNDNKQTWKRGLGFVRFTLRSDAIAFYRALQRKYTLEYPPVKRLEYSGRTTWTFSDTFRVFTLIGGDYIICRREFTEPNH